jgi:hypothetical protein
MKAKELKNKELKDEGFFINLNKFFVKVTCYHNYPQENMWIYYPTFLKGGKGGLQQQCFSTTSS